MTDAALCHLREAMRRQINRSSELNEAVCKALEAGEVLHSRKLMVLAERSLRGMHALQGEMRHGTAEENEFLGSF